MIFLSIWLFIIHSQFNELLKIIQITTDIIPNCSWRLLTADSLKHLKPTKHENSLLLTLKFSCMINTLNCCKIFSAPRTTCWTAAKQFHLQNHHAELPQVTSSYMNIKPTGKATNLTSAMDHTHLQFQTLRKY